MVDFLGKEIRVHDNIVYLSHSKSSSQYVKGKVLEFTEKKVKIKHETISRYHIVESLVAPHKIIVINSLLSVGEKTL